MSLTNSITKENKSLRKREMDEIVIIRHRNGSETVYIGEAYRPLAKMVKELAQKLAEEYVKETSIQIIQHP